MLRANIGPQIERFLRNVLEDVSPRWIVTVERKGTALLRTLVESAAGPGPKWVGWDHVVSSKALPFAPESHFTEGTVLLLDDAIHSGHRITEAWRALTELRKIPVERIQVAVFGLHERAKFKPVHHWWFGALSKENYFEVRKSIIQLFQLRGSLLLDTEHVEVPVEINCGRLEFFDALCRAGQGVEYVSSGGRHNLTVHDPVILGQDSFVESLPDGTVLGGAISKIRVIEREKNWFAIIPIFYPSTPKDSMLGSLSRLYPCLSEIAGHPELNFQLVSVFASIKLFQTVFACLRALVNNGKVRVCVPKAGDPRDTIGHLKAIFPKINLEELHLEVEKSVEAGRAWKLRKSETRYFERIEAADGSRHSDTLKGLYWKVLTSSLRYTDRRSFGNSGASYEEILNSTQLFGTAADQRVIDALTGTAVDIAIDEAQLVSDTKEFPFSDGRNRISKVLKLDGEVVLSDVRRANAMWRFPYAPIADWSPASSWR
jgi:hypothetical protein